MVVPPLTQPLDRVFISDMHDILIGCGIIQGVLEQRCLSGGNYYRVAQIRVVQGLCHTSDGIFQAKPRSSEDFHNFP